METHPEQVEVILADINDDYQLLVSLAMEVEKEEGRGEMKVIYIFFYCIYRLSCLGNANLFVHLFTIKV